MQTHTRMEGMTTVKTYDSLIGVSKMNGRTESAESTMTIDDQRAANRQAVSAAGGRIGKTLQTLDQSGFRIPSLRRLPNHPRPCPSRRERWARRRLP